MWPGLFGQGQASESGGTTRPPMSAPTIVKNAANVNYFDGTKIQFLLHFTKITKIKPVKCVDSPDSVSCL